MTIAIAPKLLRHWTGGLYAYRGTNQIAYRFGNRITVAEVRRKVGPFFVLGPDFFEAISQFTPAPGAKNA
jgi:hypothetical protein